MKFKLKGGINMRTKLWSYWVLLLLIIIFSGAMVMAEDLHSPDYQTQEQIWFFPEFFPDAGAALGAIKNIQAQFVGWQGCPVRQIELDRYGLRVFGVLDTTYDKWVYTGLGFTGGHYETVPYHEEETSVIPFEQVRHMSLHHYPKLERDNKYGVRISLADGKQVNFRTKDAATAKQLADAIATLVLASGNKIYPLYGFSVFVDVKAAAKVKKKLKWKGEDGAVVSTVVPGSPAALGGLKANDLILELNGSAVSDGKQFLEQLAKIPGFSALIELKVFSGGAIVDRKIQLLDPNQGWSGQTPPATTENTTKPSFGISVRSVNADDQKTLGLPTANGLLVTEVKQGTTAERMALRVNDLILAVNGSPIESLDQLKAALATEVKTVKVFRNGSEILLETAVSL